MILIILISCSRDKSVDERLPEKAESIAGTPGNSGADEYMGDYAAEFEYSSGDISACDGIVYWNPSLGVLSDGGQVIQALGAFEYCRFGLTVI